MFAHFHNEPECHDHISQKEQCLSIVSCMVCIQTSYIVSFLKKISPNKNSSTTCTLHLDFTCPKSLSLEQSPSFKINSDKSCLVVPLTDMLRLISGFSWWQSHTFIVKFLVTFSSVVSLIINLCPKQLFYWFAKLCF